MRRNALFLSVLPGMLPPLRNIAYFRSPKYFNYEQQQRADFKVYRDKLFAF